VWSGTVSRESQSSDPRRPSRASSLLRARLPGRSCAGTRSRCLSVLRQRVHVFPIRPRFRGAQTRLPGCDPRAQRVGRRGRSRGVSSAFQFSVFLDSSTFSRSSNAATGTRSPGSAIPATAAALLSLFPPVRIRRYPVGGEMGWSGLRKLSH
jgi:hypothetical protein